MQKKRNRRAAPMEDRFWPKVNRDGPVPEHRPELGPCWLWTAATYPNGYGMFGMGRRGTGVKGAHIVSWELANNTPVPDGQWVCHRCDNKLCVNPAHLFLGTPRDDVQDMIEKGRAKWQIDPAFGYITRGDTHPRATLTEAVIREIYRRYAGGGIYQKDLALEYGVGQSTISRIALGKERAILPAN